MERNVLGGIVILAFVARYSLLDDLEFVTWDGAYYINFFRDEAWRWVFPPGYPMLIEAVRLFVSDGVRAAQTVSLVFGSLLPIPFYYLSKKFLKPGLAFAAVLVVTFNPLMIRYGAISMSESAYLFFAVSAFALYVYGRMVPFGLAGGIAYLIRPEALVFFGLLMLILLFQKQFKPLLWGAIGFAVFAIPYVLHLRVETGTWTLTPKSMNIRVWEKDWKANVARERMEVETSMSEVVKSAIENYPWRFWEYSVRLFKYGGFPLVVVSLVGIYRYRNALLAGLAMFLLVPLFGLNPSERFVLQYFPFLAIFAMLAIQKAKWWWSGLLLTAVTLLSFLPTIRIAAQPDEEFPEMRETGRALQSVTQRTDVLWDRKPYTAFYAGGRFEMIPNEPLDTLLALFRAGRARYLVLHQGVTRVFRPQLVPLLQDSRLVEQSGLREVLTYFPGTSREIRVLEVRR